ncbi:hypothetical protein RB595_000684 [Gaeumannomyces hyphopodioides]
MIQRLCARTALVGSRGSTAAATGTRQAAGLLVVTPSPRPFLRHFSAAHLGGGGAGATSATPRLQQCHGRRRPGCRALADALPSLSSLVVVAAGFPSAAPAPSLWGRRRLSLSGPWRARSGGPRQQPHKGAADDHEAVGAPRSSSPSTSSPSPRLGPAVSQGAARLASPPALATRENIYTIPNMLTASRLIAAPVVGYAILHDQHALALGLFAYAGLSDLLDGWIARRWNQGTVVGTIIDPMADKTLMLVLTLSLAAKGALPLWLVALIIGRDVGLAIAAIYYRWVSLPPPKTFRRYWDFSLPSAEVRPTTISKYNTFLQLGLMGLTATAPVVPLDLAGSLTILQYVVAVTTVWSGASYVFSKDAVKILSDAKSASTKR